MEIQLWSDSSSYAAQTRLFEETLAAPGHALDTLLQRMRATGQAALYLAGSRLDHDFCLGSTDLGMLLSVLPEDAAKASIPGYHPESVETYITFQGSLVMECLTQGGLESRIVDPDRPLTLPAGQCHRLQRLPATTAASLIVKTNLAAEPKVIRCENCGYFKNPPDCPLHRQWKTESALSIPPR